MLFNSLQFLLFFLGVIPVALLLRRNKKPRNLFLLLSSYVFYGCWDPRFLALIFASTMIDFWAAKIIDRRRNTPQAKAALLFSLCANLGFLGFFKYYNFFLENLETLLGVRGPALSVIVPVGISFYTFQTMSYTIDVHRERLRPTESFLDFALYVAFFPQLVAGPIERASSLLPQLSGPAAASLSRICSGAHLIAWGLFKKCVIADNLGPRVVDPIFDPAVNVTGWVVLLGTYAFAYQIYCDFSGYSDIAIGCARIMGFDFRENFNLPYFAVDPSDFWRRWHISLSSWLRDYLYISLGGNRSGQTQRNLMLTMLLGGLWHGASWNFVVWGYYHGILLVLFRLDASGLKLWSRLSQPLRIFLFFHLTCIGWLIFRVRDMEQLKTMASGFVRDFYVSFDPNLVYSRAFLLFAGPLFILQVLQRLSPKPLFGGLPWPVKAVFYAVGFYVFITLGEFGSHEFIYFQF